MQSLWIGERLSKLEQLSIRSFQYHGHPYHLYVYGHVEGVPEGVVLKNASEIVVEAAIRQFRCIANFADYFRYCLLFKLGGWWTDTDAVCLRPFDFPQDHVFSSEAKHRESGAVHVNCGHIRVPQGCSMMLEAIRRIYATDLASVKWSEIGPQLMHALVEQFGYSGFVKEPRTFCPVPWWDTRRLAQLPCSTEGSYAVHLWNEMWRQNGMDKDAEYPAGSLYEQLKKEYLN